MTPETRWPWGPIMILCAGAVGVLLSLYAYFVPLTGITGSAGALLVTGSSAALVVDAAILSAGDRQIGVLDVLGLGPAWCHRHDGRRLVPPCLVVAGANIVVLLGLILALVHRGPTRTLA